MDCAEGGLPDGATKAFKDFVVKLCYPLQRGGREASQDPMPPTIILGFTPWELLKTLITPQLTTLEPYICEQTM